MTVTIDQFMAGIRQMESGGNYKAMGVPTNYGRATGAYQFIDSTWGGYGGYHSAADAPVEVQDAKARSLMQSYYDYVKKAAPNFNDDQIWSTVAMGWMGGRGAMDNYIKHGASLSYDPYSKMSPDAYSRRVMSYVGSAPVGKTGAVGATPGSVPPQKMTKDDWTAQVLPTTMDMLLNRPANNVLAAGQNNG